MSLLSPMQDSSQSAALAEARSILLTPYGLDDAALLSTLGSMFTHKIDYADLYFQFTRSEGWSLEEGIVKSGSFAIDMGVGVRAVSGDKTAFAYSDEISSSALQSAAQAARSIARQGAGRGLGNGEMNNAGKGPNHA